MPVKCLICDQEFKKIITGTHLKKHDITTKGYAEKYGKDALSCPEYRKSRSEKYSGKNNPNYGKTHDEETRKRMSENRKGSEAWNKGTPLTEQQKAKQSQTMREKYESGEITNWSKGKSRDTEYRKKISEGVSRYASENKDELSDRGKRSFETMRERYGDDYLTVRMNRMREGQTDESKAKSKAAIIAANQKKKESAFSALMQFFENEGIEFIEYDDPYIKGRCKCGNLFEVTRQNFTPSKYKTEHCQFCIPKNRSRLEMEVEEFMESDLGLDLYTSDKKQIWPYELDIYSEEHKIAVEFCGLYWHSELFGKGKTYHKDKLDKCRGKGITLIQIFEHEWLYRKDIVKSILRAKFGKSNVLYARKCTVEEIPNKQANVFLKDNHLQSSGRSNVCYGLIHNDELMGVMTMSNSNVTRKLSGWEINRMAFKQGTNIVGGASKMFNRFLKDYEPEQVISFAELRYGEGDVYAKLGFEKEYDSPPNYWYFKVLGGQNYLDVKHRFALRKNYKKGVDDPNKTEWENRQKQGWNRIWDCGHAKWVWEK